MKMLLNIAHDVALLDHFYEHYKVMGITEFHIGILEGAEWLHQVERWAFKKGIRTHRFKMEDRMQGARDSVDQNDTRKAVIDPGEWYAVADLDEFVVFASGKSFPEMVDAAQICGCNVVTGGMYDRITADGELPEELWENIWDQFPVCLELTKHLVGGNSSKMVLARGDVVITHGHHADPSVQSLHVAQVHHFKWRASVVTMLERRMEEYKAAGRCWQDSFNVLEHLNKNGGYLNVEELIRKDVAHRIGLCNEVVEFRRRQ